MSGRVGWLLAIVLAVILVVLVAAPGVRTALVPAPVALSPSPGVSLAPNAGTRLAPAPEGSVRAVVERARPAVVQITTEQIVTDRFGRPVSSGTGVGSGAIYDPSGLILTNNHVVEGARTLVVALPGGQTYPGRLLGGDREMDLAVVKIDPGPGEVLPTIPLRDSNALAVGDPVVAIGNALGLPGGPTVTAGVVSALGRAIQEPSETPGEPGPYLYDLIQTDAAINPGNSGGPLLNMAGEVVGINTLSAGGDGETMAQGIGFAIAMSAARPIADQLASTGRAVHAYLGVAYALVNPGLATQLGLAVKEGIVLGQVAANSPAERAGLRSRDVITAAEGQPIRDETALGRLLSQRRPGDRVQLIVQRGSQQLTVEVTLAERPSR